MRKVALHLFGKFDVSSFIESGIVEELADEFELNIYADEQALYSISKIKLNSSVKLFEQNHHTLEKIYKIFVDALMIELRDKSRTFQNKLRWVFLSKYGYSLSSIFRRLMISESVYSLKPKYLFYKYLFFPLLFIKPVRKSVLFFFYQILLPWVSQNEIRRRLRINGTRFYSNFDLAILPTRNLLFTPFILQSVYSSLDIPTLLVITNWDNISTKPMPEIKFAALTCAGQQSKDHYSEIYGYESQNIFPIGLPRFNNLRSRLIQHNSLSSRKILYVGSGFPHNEYKLNVEVAQMLHEIYGYEDFEIHVKTHPEASTRLSDLSPVEAQIISNNRVSRISNELNNLYIVSPTDFFKQYQIVISGPTTMALEAKMFAKVCILDASSLGEYPVEPYFALQKMKHLEGLRDIFEGQVGEDALEIATLIDLAFRNRSRVTQINESAGNYFLHDSSKFSLNLKKIIHEILGETI